MSAFDLVIRLVYLAVATCFVLGLHLMNSPVTARRGNLLSAAAMAAGVAATAVVLVHAATVRPWAWAALAAGAALGSGAGLLLARRVRMTAMPQLVSLFNAVGGGAAALIGVHDFTLHVSGTHGASLPVVLDVLIGAVTFSGSLVAAGKLQGVVPSHPILFPGARALTAVLVLAMAGASILLLTGNGGLAAFAVLAVAALGFGVSMVAPIGGADMPVVISLLNAFTGTAVAMAGFALGNGVLITAGALVGASGTILTKLMADAMNRSLTAIIAGGFGTGDDKPIEGPAGQGRVRSLSADDAAIQLAYATRVVVIPGYGLAAAQAQHQLHELAQLLEQRGVRVSYAVHPVAGRMPGHMNVLLAEAGVPYPQLADMENANAAMPQTDVAFVVGANDVVNPAARRPGTAVSGMPIIDADRAKSVIVIKRSMGHGYAGIDNELYTDPRTGMYFADAKRALGEITAAVKVLVG
ncbi:NAD(P) transhydrogenase subunit beta [[Actinomadura] parvosata subsp. kistnae]|uniref:NAD(P) transhydrogenase subunit beta n=1 Tax=[Actinomadura] parvosata subsp. kistnae TaxID=1909395 RepID=A0A1U9ZZ77_9ACTN|nr:NAD(P)(+) transhydrogenase (Re/Si-specific) subunit beta [Nonomuraea sp. ATCC 55076]AQZ63229.1 NAD(P) transhydrogenase subunit beta [Nonomuraea sp. ATCC 55076]SPL98907.1 NAD(P) transhydrogenase subunit beta [Actinomadura parvosata subsp. kistnae]